MIGRTSGFWRLLAESAVIVMSVILALLAEDWRSERDARGEVQEALRSVDREIAANLLEVESFLNVVRERYARLMQVGEELDGSQPFAEYVSDFGGFRVPDLQLSAWSRVESDPRVRGFAPDRLDAAFLVYRDLGFLSRLDEEIVDFTLSPQYHDEATAGVGYRIAEAILSQQIQHAVNSASRIRTFLGVNAPGER